MKYKRQSRILKIIQEQPVKTHEQLVDILKNEGMSVTQATVSRDIKELGLVKTASPDGGSMYSAPNAIRNISSGSAINNSIGSALTEIRCAMHTVVIKTYPGMASAMCAFIDEKLHTEFIGSIAGDDTIIIITQDTECAEVFVKKFKGMLNRGA